MRLLAALLLFFPAPVWAAQLLFAGGQWVALDRGATCEAASRSIRIAPKGKVQARAGLAFDGPGPRRGQFFAQLSRGDQPFLLVSRGDWAWSRGSEQEAAIQTAIRSAGGMRIQARNQAGGRFTDRYLLDGAPTAIDAAAARCAGKMPRN